MNIEFIEVYENYLDTSGPRYNLRKTKIAADSIIRFYEDIKTSTLLQEGKLPEGLSPTILFTKILLRDKESVIVVGSPEEVNFKLEGAVKNTTSKRKVLNG